MQNKYRNVHSNERACSVLYARVDERNGTIARFGSQSGPPSSGEEVPRQTGKRRKAATGKAKVLELLLHEPVNRIPRTEG